MSSGSRRCRYVSRGKPTLFHTTTGRNHTNTTANPSSSFFLFWVISLYSDIIFSVLVFFFYFVSCIDLYKNIYAIPDVYWCYFWTYWVEFASSKPLSFCIVRNVPQRYEWLKHKKFVALCQICWASRFPNEIRRKIIMW